MRLPLLLLLTILAASCTKPGPACCTSRDDCASIGVSDDVRGCTEGLACVDHACVAPDCATDGCAASTPVCNIDTGACAGCTGAADCDQFGDADVCDTATGSCVECVSASDCDVARPVCDGGACRACKLDSECDSGACGDDGECVSEDSIVYLNPAGQDSGSCTRLAPCKRLAFAASRATSDRSHIVLQTGAYVDVAVVDATSTSATSIFVHGGGSTLSAPASNDGTTLKVSMPTTIRDLEIVSTSGTALAASTAAGSILIERVTVRGRSVGVTTAGQVTMRDVTADGGTTCIDVGTAFSSHLTFERGVVKGCTTGVLASGFGAVVDLTNALVFGCSGLALDLSGVTGGSVRFVTVADSGTDSGPGPRAVTCNTNVSVANSIIWAPGTVQRAAIDGCGVVSSIVGPTPVSGTLSADPQFVNSSAGDYHIGPTSPAIDAVDSGPSTDFENDPRPQGARFDLGADEAR